MIDLEASVTVSIWLLLRQKNTNCQGLIQDSESGFKHTHICRFLFRGIPKELRVKTFDHFTGPSPDVKKTSIIL